MMIKDQEIIRELTLKAEFANQLLRDCLILAMYIRGEERPTPLSDDIKHVRKLFNLTLDRWDMDNDV